MSLSLADSTLSPRPRFEAKAHPSGLAALIRPARLELWVGADGCGELRDPDTGETYTGDFASAPERAAPWRIDRLFDRSTFARHFRTHDEESAPILVRSEPLFGGRPAIRTVALDKSGFILRLDGMIRRPLAMFAVLEGSGSNRVISESVNGIDEPLPDLGNIIDFATSTASANPVPIAFQNGNGTPGTTRFVPGETHIVAAIYAANETFVRVDGVVEGYEAGLTNGYIADSLSLLNNPTVRHGDNRWAGAFGEYMLISGTLDEPRISAIERQLAARWGITLAVS